MSFSGCVGDHLRARLGAIRERELNVGCVGDDVQAGEDVAAIVNNDTAPYPIVYLTVRVRDFRLDENERGLDRLVHARRKGGWRRGRREGLGNRSRSPHASSVEAERERERYKAGAPRTRLTHRQRTAPRSGHACGGAAGVVATALIVKQKVRSFFHSEGKQSIDDRRQLPAGDRRWRIEDRR